MDIKIGFLENSVPEHRHKYYEIIIFTKGAGIFQSEKAEAPFSTGNIIIIPPETSHKCISENEFERIFINGNFDWIPNLLSPVILQSNYENDGIFLARLIYDNRFKNPEYLALLINAFISYIIQSIKIDDKINLAIKSIINEITERFFDCNINLNAILNKSGYSEDYIRAEFKKSTGKTPVRYLTEIRISHSCLLIDMYKKSLSLAKIAEKCGYTDYLYFSRRFKEIMGMSPREYMKIV